MDVWSALWSYYTTNLDRFWINLVKAEKFSAVFCQNIPITTLLSFILCKIPSICINTLIEGLECPMFSLQRVSWLSFCHDGQFLDPPPQKHIGNLDDGWVGGKLQVLPVSWSSHWKNLWHYECLICHGDHCERQKYCVPWAQRNR